MSEQNDLQFERAEFDAVVPQAACAACGAPLFGSYFQVNGRAVCERCCYALREQTAGGSRLGRVFRASAAGAAAALGGAILYWAILALTGYEFGLIAIVVGIGVGKAVSWGSHRRGGWAYQGLAIVLTYLALVSAYVPLLVKEAMKQSAETHAAAPVNSTTVTPAAAETPLDTTVRKEPGAEAGSVLLALGLLLAIACAAPFLAGVQNIIGLVIIGIGLFEAWKLNRRQPLVITGPHALASTGAIVAAP